MIDPEIGRWRVFAFASWRLDDSGARTLFRRSVNFAPDCWECLPWQLLATTMMFSSTMLLLYLSMTMWTVHYCWTPVSRSLGSLLNQATIAMTVECSSFAISPSTIHSCPIYCCCCFAMMQNLRKQNINSVSLFFLSFLLFSAFRLM